MADVDTKRKQAKEIDKQAIPVSRRWMPYVSRIFGRFKLSIRLLIALAVGLTIGFVSNLLHPLGPSSATLILSTIGWLLVLVGFGYYFSVYYLLPIYTSVHVEAGITIHAPMEKVLALDTDYTGWPKFNPQIKSARLISEKDNERILEVEQTNGLRHQETQRILANRIEHKVDEARWKDNEVWSYEAILGGTRLTIAADFSVRGFRVRRWLTKGLEKGLRTALESQKKLAES